MSVKYLSQQWVDDFNARLAEDSSIAAAFKGKNAILQNVITGTPEGEVRYWLRVVAGTPSAGLGDAGDAEVTITQSYDTAAQINKGALDGQRAFMQGKVKVNGKMMKMMQLRGPMEQVQKALSAIDTEY
jgi:putative sterol carrier protein